MVVDFMRKLVDVANRASVVFYTIDPRGLVVTGITAADQIVDPSPERLSQILSDEVNSFLKRKGFKAAC